MADLINASAKHVIINATATASTALQLPEQGHTIRLANEGPSTVYVAVGPTGTLATLPATTFAGATRTSTAVLPGEDACFTLGWHSNNERYISAICDTGKTARLFVAVGEGV
jgi:hypothetical protein